MKTTTQDTRPPLARLIAEVQPSPETLTGPLLVALDHACHNYPEDVQGQQRHFSSVLPSAHEEFESHLESTYSERQLEILAEAIARITA